MLNAEIVFWTITIYFLAIFIISFFTSRDANTSTFFNADKSSHWFLVSYGMVGATISGVTFISVPGWVGTKSFSYLQMVFGYLLGYAVIASFLLPLYYKLNLVSIYTYLEERFGFWSYKTGAFFFLISRTIGSSFRLFLVANVLHIFLFKELGIGFAYTVLISIALIWLYTFRGGIKTIVWTDVFQTTFLLAAVAIAIYKISYEMDWQFSEAMIAVQESGYAKSFFWEAGSQNFFNQFFAGAFIAIVMTGLDQDMMQKNLTCRSIGDAQKNMYWYSFILVIVNIFFLVLGAMLYLFAQKKGIAIPANSDDLFPMIAKEHLGLAGGIIFLLGVVAAAYSSADSALTALTTSFCIDFLDFNKTKTGEAKKRMRRIQVHLMFSAITFLVIMIFHLLMKYQEGDKTVINAIFSVASYTYGPLLGLFTFGMFTKWKVKDGLVPLVCVLAPMISWLLNYFSKKWFNGYEFGYELLIINGGITFLGLLLLMKKEENL
jgi:Na+/proline symporter